jgi:dTDP-glucose pyrophosphorylase
MAGRGSRFADVGYELPKPLIDVSGRPMIDWVVENISPSLPHKFIFIAQREHCVKYGLTSRLQAISNNCEIVLIDGVTEGAACTVLCAREFIDNDTPLMIANSDQWINTSVDDYLNAWNMDECLGYIMTMESDHPKWSYVKFDDSGAVTDVIEKVVVSDQATVGIYNFSSGSLFCKYADRMIEENNRSKGEFYVAPVYQYLIDKGEHVGLYNIGKDQVSMYGLGTPEDLDLFLRFKNDD